MSQSVSQSVSDRPSLREASASKNQNDKDQSWADTAVPCRGWDIIMNQWSTVFYSISSLVNLCLLGFNNSMVLYMLNIIASTVVFTCLY